MTTAEFIELAKASAWPAVVAWGLWYFRDAIIGVLPRVTKVGPVALEPLPPPQPETKKAILGQTATNEGIKRLEALMPPELLSEGKQLIAGSVPINSQGDRIDEVEYLTTLAATLTLIALFESTYRTIWGSQLQLLQVLNSGPMPVESSKSYYDKATQEYPLPYQTYNFDQWVAFLVESALVRREADGQLMITIRGRGFLRFLIESGYSLLKPF